MKNSCKLFGKWFFYVLVIGLITFLSASFAMAVKIDAADAKSYEVLNRGPYTIKIDSKLDDWARAENILFMGKDTWEALGGTHKNDNDLSAELRIVYDADNIYFGLQVKDDEYVAEAANPWENDGVQIAIDSSGGKIPPGFPNASTHLYNFSIKEGWQKETGPFLGDAEIEMIRDDATKQTFFEWRMPAEIIGGKNFDFKAGMEMAFAIIINDSDQDAKGQTGWVGWGSQTIVFGKNPEEMKTLILSKNDLAVDIFGKLSATWGEIKK